MQTNQGKTALDMAANPRIQEIISKEMNRRKKITAKIPSFLQKKYNVPLVITNIIFEMEGAKPSK